MKRLIIVGAPRSGAGLLQELLLLDPKFKATDFSSRDFIRGVDSGSSSWEIARAKPIDFDPASNLAVDYSPHFSGILDEIQRELPESKYVFVVRRPIDALQSLLFAWESKRFAHWSQPEGWWGLEWSFGLIPRAETLIGKPIPEVVVEQFLTLSQGISDFINGLSSDKYQIVSFEDLIDNPQGITEDLANFIGTKYEGNVPNPIPFSRRSLGRGRLAKHIPVRFELEAALKDRATSFESARNLWLANTKSAAPKNDSIGEEESPQESVAPSQGTPFSSTFTNSFAMLLKQLGATLAISTYKSGHVILASELDGKVNTTFQRFNRPMGLAASGSRLAVGTLDAIRSFNNQPGIASGIEPKNFFDAVFAPRNTVFTGDIAIHELAYGWNGSTDELWFINTSFSCLCRMDPNYSFVPVWKPAWITGLAGEDRCHLNGLAMVNSQPKFVTALSETDTAFGWREGKGSSGVIIDVTSDAVIARGLAMPHSPRWHEGRLWVLESGKGSLAKVNLETGEIETVATLPGFTRGLEFVGPYALVGLSQVRESVFKDLPVTNTQAERNCGVWVVDTRTGETAGVLKFDGVVTEIFDITLLVGSKLATIVDTSQATLTSYTLPEEALKTVVNNRS